MFIYIKKLMDDNPMKKLILLILAFSFTTIAADFKGSFSTGIIMGTPYWNKANLEDGGVIDSSDSFLRVVNRLRINGKFAENFTFGMNAIRSDGFQSDNRLSRTKIQQFYAAYKFSSGNIQAGRLMPFNRWIMGSIDGLSVAYKLSDMFSFKALGGMNVRYGKLYDSDDTQTVGYGEIGIHLKKYGGKVKFYNDEDKTKTGLDFHGKINKLRFNTSVGFNMTDEALSDGSLGLFYPVNNKFTVSGHYRMFRLEDWELSNIIFEGYLIDRFSLGFNYKIFDGYTMDFRQMLALTEKRNDYISYFTFSGKYFHVGANYLTGDSNFQRMGFSIGGNYSPMKDLYLSAGVSPVDYLLDEEEDHIQSTAVYFRANYKIIKSLGLRLNFNYYNNNNALNENIRGGLNITYYFGN
jgi:hypothetical protein